MIEGPSSALGFGQVAQVVHGCICNYSAHLAVLHEWPPVVASRPMHCTTWPSESAIIEKFRTRRRHSRHVLVLKRSEGTMATTLFGAVRNLIDRVHHNAAASGGVID